MKIRTLRGLVLATAAIAIAAPNAVGCASERAARNGVFNENVYLRKDFLVRGGNPTGQDEKGQPTYAPDRGWMMKATIIQTSTPNPLAPSVLFTGAENNGALVRFQVAQENLKLVNMRELSNDKEWLEQDTRTAEVVDTWPASSVDVKYRVNLDGEKTNFLEENQELDWQKRQWVKVHLAKSDMSDLMAFGAETRFLLERCTEMSRATSSLVPDSVKVDEQNDYMEWQVEHSFPVRFSDEACVQSYGEEGMLFQKMGRQNITVRAKYSFVRAKPIDSAEDPGGYKLLEVGEKDPIRRKYGPIVMPTIARDTKTGMLSSRELAIRYNPKKDIHYFFAKGFPEKYKYWFAGKGVTDPGAPSPTSMAGQTNAIFQAAGRDIKIYFWNYDTEDPRAPGKGSREYGDVRYSFVRWESDIDTGSPFIGVAQFVPDPRTGELISSSVNIADSPLRDFVVQRLDAYLKTIGASPKGNPADLSQEWDTGTCEEGDTMPIAPEVISETHNRSSSLYSKMQDYLGRPAEKEPDPSRKFLSPHDFVPAQDADFFKAYYRILPYYVFADPMANQFVIPEGGNGVFGPEAQFKSYAKEAEFHALAGRIDRGEMPYDGLTTDSGPKNALKFLNDFRELTLAHKDHVYKQAFRNSKAHRDTAGELVSFINMMKKNARHCTFDTAKNQWRWETKTEWVDNLIESYHALTLWHEFGHILGLEHNFMGSVDEPNFPRYKDKKGTERYGMYQSTVMEYNNTVDRVFWKNELGVEGWGPYDRAAIGFIYGNDTDSRDTKAASLDSISGQYSATSPWKDPLGFQATGERQFLFCTHQHIKYTPLCRQFDAGTRPSEIVANEIDNYEWQYQWRNFRIYRKIWDNSQYANTPGNLIPEMRRFLSLWGFSWSSGDLVQILRRLGIEPPADAPNRQNYYSQLAAKFNKELSEANQVVGAFHKAIIQQASGERPYRTTYDNYFGEVTQQGIILDKLFAMQGWVGLWPSDNYDPNEAGSYIASYSSLGDPSYRAVAEDAITSMIGEQFYDAYPYFKPLAVMQFAQDTHSPSFGGRVELRDLIGGKVFHRKRDYLDYFRDLAVVHHKYGCTSLDACSYDPTLPRPRVDQEGQSDVYNEFIGPDGRHYAWVYIHDRNTWMFVDRDRNTATYKIVREYNTGVIRGEDDGVSPGEAFGQQLPLKYFLDAFNQFN